ncbi:hypothetical protein [Microcoleus sp. A006_D1]|uniref:hypothetical protein n=1 Tax=Microcoleus sp. A006_D1 TaxID=3055267 RepID=UPI003FA5DC8B
MNQEHAFVWNNGKLQDLNNLAMTNPTFGDLKVTLAGATGINNFGVLPTELTPTKMRLA